MPGFSSYSQSIIRDCSMGSFIGHVDEATFFLALAFWWMINSFPRYIKSRFSDGQYELQVSYCTVIRGRRVPIEQICKILFPVAGFMAEVIDGHFTFIDGNGNLTGLSHLLHMSLYGIFALHGLIDLLLTLGAKFVPPNYDFISAGVCFAWYGLSFTYHAHGTHTEPLETIIHQIPTYAMGCIAMVCFLGAVFRDSFLLDILRCLGLLQLGSWFVHISYILYIPGFPGKEENTKWDRNNMENVHFIPPLFGYHIIMNLVVVMVMYAVLYCIVVSRKRYGTVPYSVCANSDDQAALLPKNKDDDLA